MIEAIMCLPGVYAIGAMLSRMILDSQLIASRWQRQYLCCGP